MFINMFAPTIYGLLLESYHYIELIAKLYP